MLKENLNKIRLNVFICLLFILSPFLFIVSLFEQIFAKFFHLFKTKKDISGRLALVTGGGSGLGRCIALKLAENGCNIAIVDINLNALEDTVKIIKNIKKDVIIKHYKVDVSKIDEVRWLQINLEKDFKTSVDILINNAGVFGEMKKNLLPPEEIQKMTEVNILSHFWMITTFFDQMKLNKYGHIVAIGSIAGLLPSPWIFYPATKYAVRGLMKSLEYRLNQQKLDYIKTTTVYPYFLNTNQEVVECNQNYLNNLYPFIDGIEAAEIIVNGMRKDYSEIIIPQVFGRFYWLLNLIPFSWQRKFFY